MRQAEDYRDAPSLRRVLDQGAIFVATGGFSGYAGIVPGTVGSLVGLLLYLPLTASPIPSSHWRRRGAFFSRRVCLDPRGGNLED